MDRQPALRLKSFFRRRQTRIPKAGQADNRTPAAPARGRTETRTISGFETVDHAQRIAAPIPRDDSASNPRLFKELRFEPDTGVRSIVVVEQHHHPLSPERERSPSGREVGCTPRHGTGHSTAGRKAVAGVREPRPPFGDADAPHQAYLAGSSGSPLLSSMHSLLWRQPARFPGNCGESALAISGVFLVAASSQPMANC